MNLTVKSQEYKIGYKQIKFVDPERSNRTVKANIYYPVSKIKKASAIEQFPVVVFAHGFVMSTKAYKNLWEELVPNGYIFVLPKTESGISPSHLDLATDLVFLARKLDELNNDSNTVFYSRVSKNKCVAGHSMGGGSAILAAQNKNLFNCAFTLAMFTTKPSPIQAASNVTIPSLIIAGENDCVTPPDEHQLPVFNALAGETKTYISIRGGSHCQMANKNTLCNLGEKTCSPTPQISVEQQHAILNRYLVPWLNFNLKENKKAGTEFNNWLAADNEITYLPQK